MTIKQLVSKLRNELVEQQEKLVLQVIKENAEVLLDMNREQLLDGKNSKGKSLGKYANKRYAQMKRMLNSKGVVDLRLSGKFQDGFFLKAESFPILFGSKDSKAELLSGKYGDEIFGPTKENLAKFNRTILQKELVKKYKEVLGL